MSWSKVGAASRLDCGPIIDERFKKVQMSTLRDHLWLEYAIQTLKRKVACLFRTEIVIKQSLLYSLPFERETGGAIIKKAASIYRSREMEGDWIRIYAKKRGLLALPIPAR